MYECLTRLLPQFSGGEAFGEWVADHEGKGTLDDSVRFPFVDYGDAVLELEQAIYDFEKLHPEFELKRFNDILAASGIDWAAESMSDADVSALDGRTVAALILGAMRADRFCEGALLEFCESGCIARWLGRLKEIDEMAN